jgi:hypothetical protein
VRELDGSSLALGDQSGDRQCRRWTSIAAARSTESLHGSVRVQNRVHYRRRRRFLPDEVPDGLDRRSRCRSAACMTSNSVRNREPRRLDQDRVLVVLSGTAVGPAERRNDGSITKTAPSHDRPFV